MKKILLTLGVLGAVVVALPMFSAFEAHVVNVTARIENALAVSTKHIDFGTVFPQEHLDKPLTVQLSGSFMTEPDADDVEYFIRQKPKCGVTSRDGQVLVEGSTATGHVVLGDNQATEEVETYWIDCGEAPVEVPVDHVYGVLPSLCEYISKEGPDENDGDTASFHKPWVIVEGDNPDTVAVETSYIDWLDTPGRLAKSDVDTEDQTEGDTVDNWTIDLAVPCFGDHCAQDWAEFVAGINPNAGDPDQWTQDIDDEHKVFGCDLWVEVSGVSRFSDEETDNGPIEPPQNP